MTRNPGRTHRHSGGCAVCWSRRRVGIVVVIVVVVVDQRERRRPLRRGRRPSPAQREAVEPIAAAARGVQPRRAGPVGLVRLRRPRIGQIAVVVVALRVATQGDSASRFVQRSTGSRCVCLHRTIPTAQADGHIRKTRRHAEHVT